MGHLKIDLKHSHHTFFLHPHREDLCHVSLTYENQISILSPIKGKTPVCALIILKCRSKMVNFGDGMKLKELKLLKNTEKINHGLLNQVKK